MSLNYYYFRTPREAIAQSQPVILAKEAGENRRCLFSYISLPQLQTASIFVRSQRHSDSVPRKLPTIGVAVVANYRHIVSVDAVYGQQIRNFSPMRLC